MAHYLVVGGTGMLSGVVEYLAKHGHVISIISRNASSFEDLKARLAYKRLHHITCDYHQPDILALKLEEHTKLYGNFDNSVCWVHGPSDIKACLSIAAYTDDTVIHIVGSAIADPGTPELITNRFEILSREFPALNFKIAVLGFIVEIFNQTQQSRWLTNDEISQGIINCLASTHALHFVGTVTPWSLRP